MGILIVLLTILKIIGIILLTILILLALIIGIVLFSPIVYDVDGEKYAEIKGNAHVKWLFGAIKIFVEYENNEPKIVFTIFGKTLEQWQEKKSKKVKKSKKSKKPKKEKPAPAVHHIQPEEKTKVDPPKVELPKPQTPPPKVEVKEEVKKKTTIRRVPVKNEPPKEEKDIPKKENKKKDEYIDDGKVNFEYFKRLPWADKKNIVDQCFILIKKILTSISPKDVYIDLIIGTGEPELTGKILGFASILKGTINKNINVVGKFDQKIYEGKIRIMGKIILFALVLAIVKFAMSKPIWAIIKRFLKGKGE